MATHRKPKLPIQQLAILAVARFAEPLAMTSVYPYLPEMIASFGVPKPDVAKWAGLTSAVFSLAQSVTAVPWGRASDRFGRKPVIMTGLMCTMICFLIWGISSSLPMAIAVRAVQGASNGNGTSVARPAYPFADGDTVGIIRTMVAEMVPERELQPKAFSLMPLVWSIGSIFGPAFGGFFARPADQFPSLFDNSAFFKAYPFVLPNIMGAVIFLLSLTVGTLFLKETLASKRHDRDWGLILGTKLAESITRQKQRWVRRPSFHDDEATAPLLHPTLVQPAQASGAKVEKAARPSLAAVFTRQSVINLVSYTFLALHSVAYDQVLPVFLNYPRRDPHDGKTHLPFVFAGGFGLNSGSIGTIFTVYGVVCGLVQFLIFPPLCTYFGVLNCYKGCALIFPIVYILTPYTALIEGDRMRFVALMCIMVIKAFAVIIGFPCTTILLTNSASSLSILGTLNGFATTFSSLGRALGPAMAGAAFSWGLKRGIISVPWWLLAAFAVLGAIPAWWTVEGDGPSGSASLSDSDSNGPDERAISDEYEADDDNDESALPSKRRVSDAADSTLSSIPDDGINHDPSSSDDLPRVGSWKSARSHPDYDDARRSRSRRTSRGSAGLNYGAVASSAVSGL